MKLLLIAGARPNFMKIAPIIKAAEAHNQKRTETTPKLEWQLIHTGQHYDAKMSDIFFEELGIPKPDVSLEVGSGSHAVQTARIMERFEPICLEYQPDWVVVVGDVNSTVACAMVATKLGIKVAHVEAGLRSYDRTMPEEINRLITDAISDLLLPPSEEGCENLRREGIAETRIKLVGNIMIDSVVANLGKARASTILKRLELESRKFIFATLHRPSNVDSEASLRAIFDCLTEVSNNYPIVLPIHPRTRKMLEQFDIIPEVLTDTATDAASIKSRRFHVIEPVGYHDSLCLTENARLILTDSGGLQEESTYFRTPCLTLRPNTERPVTITEGSNHLTATDKLGADIRETLEKEDRLGKIPSLWDGKTAERIIKALIS